MAKIGPHHINICPWQSWVASSGTIPVRSKNSSALGGGWLGTGAGAINDMVAWDVLLTAGTWTITVIYYVFTNVGIATVKLDSTTVGTIDFYSAGTQNTVGTISGITVSADDVYRMSLNMLTKNFSSTGYGYLLHHISLLRTS